MERRDMKKVGVGRGGGMGYEGGREGGTRKDGSGRRRRERMREEEKEGTREPGSERRFDFLGLG